MKFAVSMLFAATYVTSTEAIKLRVENGENLVIYEDPKGGADLDKDLKKKAAAAEEAIKKDAAIKNEEKANESIKEAAAAKAEVDKENATETKKSEAEVAALSKQAESAKTPEEKGKILEVIAKKVS